MSDTPKAGWPETPSGAIDWETVFEDPKAGLIPLILQARSPAALRECTIAVITRIYTRKDDPSEVERFVGQLTTLVPDQTSPRHLSRIADVVVGILRQVKADRIRGVLDFEATAAASASSVPADVADSAKSRADRRSKSERLKLTALAKAAIARKMKKAMQVAGGIAAALAVAGVGIGVYIEGAPKREAKRDAALLVEQIQAVSNGKNIATHVYGGVIRPEIVGGYAAVVVEGLSLKQCISVGWVFANKGNVMINGVMAVKTSLSSISTLCGGDPENSTLTWIPWPESKKKGPRAEK